MPAEWKVNVRSTGNSGAALLSQLSSRAFEMPLLCWSSGCMPLRLSPTPQRCAVAGLYACERVCAWGLKKTVPFGNPDI